MGVRPGFCLVTAANAGQRFLFNAALNLTQQLTLLKAYFEAGGAFQPRVHSSWVLFLRANQRGWYEQRMLKIHHKRALPCDELSDIECPDVGHHAQQHD
jgi:hypothetical protein